MSEIFVAANDPSTLTTLEQMLSQEGYDVRSSQSGRDVLKTLKDKKARESVVPDLFILDVELQDVDGIALCRQLRDEFEFSQTPIVIVGERNEPQDIAMALNAGGDDYIRKPIVMRELAARVRAHLRRAYYFDMPKISIMTDTYQVFINQREISLTRVEFDLLRYLCHMPDQWHSTRELLTNVWQYPDGVGDTALVRNHVRNLRRKLEDNPDRPSVIQSRHGRGYLIRAQVSFDSM